MLFSSSAATSVLLLLWTQIIFFGVTFVTNLSLAMTLSLLLSESAS